jgi:hypothetical protein
MLTVVLSPLFLPLQNDWEKTILHEKIPLLGIAHVKAPNSRRYSASLQKEQK